MKYQLLTYLQPAFAVLLVLSLLQPAGQVSAQQLELAPDSRIWIEGTSNRSDWVVHANEMSAQATPSEASVAPSTLELTVTTAEIKSGSSTIMDRLMHEALNVAEHPTATYELVRAEPAGDAVLTTTGQLTLAGVTNEIEMQVESERGEDGSVRFTGTTPLKMSDYGMQPPTAMFGALRTGDDVTVHFDVAFVPAE